jgi:hypothetical protein
MTKRRTAIPKRIAHGPLGVSVERAAAGYLFGFWREQGMGTRAYWQAIANTHGDQITAKVREACPGTRPGFLYAIGTYPPVPLLGDPPPPEHKASREFIDIDDGHGEVTRFWYCGKDSFYVWQECQACHLRDLGEVDGAEWKRFLAWRRKGFEPRYVLDGAQHRKCSLHHLCY